MTPYEDALAIIGQRITHIRKQIGMTQAELAKKAGVSLKFMSMMESGANVSMKTLLAVSEALGMDMVSLLRTKGLPKGGRGPRPKLAMTDEKLSDSTSKEIVRRFSLMNQAQRKRALTILRTAFGK